MEQKDQLFLKQDGIVGCNYKYSVIENCMNEGNITCEENEEGGIAGINFYRVQNCENKGKVKNNSTVESSSHYIAGIVGLNSGSVVNCKNYADIIGSPTASYAVGGIVGMLGTDANIHSCANVGDVSGNKIIGGVIGDTATKIQEMKNLYNKGNVTASTNYVGGIVGRLYVTLENAYNTGKVSITSSNTTSGGMVGSLNTSVDSIKNCYYLDTSAEKAIGNNITVDITSSKTSEEIKNLADILGDAFKNSNEGECYPKLRWES